MNNLEQAFLSGFVKRAKAYGLTAQKATSLFKEAATPQAIRGMLGRAPNLTHGFSSRPRLENQLEAISRRRQEMAGALKRARSGNPAVFPGATQGQARAQFSNLAHGLEGNIASGTPLGDIVGPMRTWLGPGAAADAAKIRNAAVGRGPEYFMDRYNQALAQGQAKTQAANPVVY